MGGAVIGGAAAVTGGAVGTYIGQNLSFAAAGTVAGAAGGLVAGAIGGGGFAALSSGNIGEGIWKGVLSGVVGGAVGAYLGGGSGAFIGGAAAGAVGSALNGGDAGDILATALLSGAISWEAYQLQQGAAYSQYKKEDGSFTRKQFQKISVAAQRSFARGREYGGWVLGNGDVEMWPIGEHDGMNPTPKPDNATGMFHSHPNWGLSTNGEPWIEPHSNEDIRFNNSGARVKSYVIGRQNVYLQRPGSLYGSLLYENSLYNPYPNKIFNSLRINR